MGWARLDDGFHDHPKVDELSLAAIGLWTVCLTWAHRHRRTSKTPGLIPDARARKAGGRQAAALAGELTAAGLWETTDGGWLIHDFDDYGPKQRDGQEASEAGRRGAAARWQKAAKPIATSHEGATNPDSFVVAIDASRASAPASPSRPVPTTRQESARKLASSFAEFWAAYPKKTAKGDAEKAWPKAVKILPADELIAAAVKFAAGQRGVDPQFIPYPATWLNRKQWEDEATPVPARRDPDAWGTGRSGGYDR